MSDAARPAEDSRLDRQRVASIAAAIGCISAVGVGLSLSIPLLSLEMERMGVSGIGIGANTAVAGLAAVLFVPFAPRLAARFGVSTLLWGAVLVAAVTMIAFKLFFSFAAWFPLRFVFSAAIGCLFVLSEYWINAVAPPGRRGLVMGIYATVLALGFAAGPAVLALVGTSGWAPYLAGALLVCVAALPLLLARGLSPAIGHGPARSVVSMILVAPIATIAALVFGAVETGGFAILPVYGVALGMSAEGAAFLVSLVALGNVALQIPIGIVSDRVDRRLLLLAAAVVGVAGSLAMPIVAGSPILFGAVLFVWGGVVGALYTVGLAHLGARFSGPDLASANAAFVILYNVGMMVGPPVIGGGLDLVRPHGFAYATALLFAAYLAVVLARMGTSRR
ncbi:MFS transporter [Salinarimonas rosea]|uniref:MFS transporter n=1 Tax=Salinarimonas rosea TaxID=552063 RepID=UPI0003F5CB5F|nr:MFS transporter [Salinarimonas rosea]